MTNVLYCYLPFNPCISVYGKPLFKSCHLILKPSGLLEAADEKLRLMAIANSYLEIQEHICLSRVAEVPNEVLGNLKLVSRVEAKKL